MSERRAYFCEQCAKSGDNVPTRIFRLPGTPVPICKDHPGSKMVVQPNKPYMKGKSRKS